MAKTAKHPRDDDNPHVEPDRFLVGERAVSSATSLTDRVDYLDHRNTGGVVPPPPSNTQTVSVDADEPDDEPGLIRYKTERLSIDELRHRDEAKLKFWVIRWGLILISVLALIAVAMSDSPSTTAMALIANVLTFVTGVMYGRKNHKTK